MNDMFNSYYILFTVIFTFIFSFLQEKCIDKIMPYFSGARSTKFSKWFNGLLYLYSKSNIENDSKYLSLFLVLFLSIGLQCVRGNYLTLNHSILPTILILLVIFSPKLPEKALNLLFSVSNWDIVLIPILIIIKILLDKPNLLDTERMRSEEYICRYIGHAVLIIFFLKFMLFIIALVINFSYKSFKLFIGALVKYDNPTKYIAKYLLIAGSSYLLSIGCTMLFTWGQSIVSKAFTKFIFTFLH